MQYTYAIHLENSKYYIRWQFYYVLNFFVIRTLKTYSGHSKSQRCVSTANALHACTQAHLMYKIFMTNYSWMNELMTENMCEKGIAWESSFSIICAFICKLSEICRKSSTASILQAVWFNPCLHRLPNQQSQQGVTRSKWAAAISHPSMGTEPELP